MIDYKYKDFYNDTSVSKRMQIQCSDGSVLNEDDWKGESAELTERLCSESELSFGSGGITSIFWLMSHEVTSF